MIHSGICFISSLNKWLIGLGRTLATDLAFKKRVREDMLVRLLDAFVWRHHQEPHDSQTDLGFTYVQGMNVLAAPFLYIMPTEIEAFWSFSKFIEFHCPLYVQPTLEGVHRGLKVRICNHLNILIDMFIAS